MNTLRRLVVGLVCSRGFLNYQRFRTSLPLIIFRLYSTHLINPIQVGIKSTSRGTSLLEHLSKALEDVKHNTKLLHWDSRSPTEISEQCTHMNTKYQELPENLKETMEGFKLNKLYMLVFSSNKVEGLQISLGDTMRLLQTWAAKSEAEIVEELKNTPQQTKHGEPPVKRVVLQHFLAACHLCEKPPPLTEDLIKHEHKVLMDGLLDDDGEYRTEDIMTQGRLFIPPKYVPEAMTTLIKDFKWLKTVV